MFKKLIISITVIFLLQSPMLFVKGDQLENNIFTKSIESTEGTYEYYNYQNMTNLLYELQENYSDIMSFESYGKTYQGRDIWIVKLSDNVSEEEDEPGVLLMGAHHGNEKPSYEILIFFIKYMVEYYKKEDRVGKVINNTQIFLIPMVNPDGVEANTRKNCVPNYGIFGFRKKITSYGVDLNRNYEFDWNYYKIHPILCSLYKDFWDKSPTYRGPYPFSENETLAVKQFVEKHDISLSISYHTFLEKIFYPWFHNSQPTPDQELFFSIGENMTKINGYKLYKPTQIPILRDIGTPGTSEEWLYGKHHILAFTIELCNDSYAPTYPEIIIDTCWKHVGVNLYACERAVLLK